MKEAAALSLPQFYFIDTTHSICKKNKIADDTLWCSLVYINVSTELWSCVRVTLSLDWHRVVALSLELQQTLSHRINGTAVSDLSGCYKLIVFDLSDAFDCQETYIVPNVYSVERAWAYLFKASCQVSGNSGVQFELCSSICNTMEICWN